MNLGRYELLEKLASGGMGEVFLGRSVGAEGFEKLVAIKRIYPDLATHERHREMFVREAKLVARMTHPNIAQVYELNEDADGLYIVMEFIDGTDLSRVIQLLRARGEHLSAPLVAIIAFDALNALDHAHRLTDNSGRSLGIVHRDISPHNILLTPEGFVKLCDFGVARVAEGTGTQVGIALGKLAYIAPEQFLGGAVDGRVDVFSLGAVTYEMLTASKLFRTQGDPEALELMERCIDNPLQLKKLDDCPPLLLEALEPALFFDGKKRYQSAAAFRDQLERYLATTNPVGARRALAELVAQLRPTYDATTQELDTVALEAAANASPHWTRVIERTEQPEVSVNATVAIERRFGARHAIAGAAVLLAGLATGLWVAAPWGPIPTANTTPPAEAPVDPQPPANNGAPPIELPAAEPLEPAKRRHKSARSSGVARENSGFLSLNSRPWARVTVDGVPTGRTTPLLSYPLAPGTHRVRLDGPGGVSQVLKIRIRAKETVTRFVKLK